MSASSAATFRTIAPTNRLRGTLAVPGDKSISHRAAIFNAISEGDAVVENFLTGDDCMSTVGVLQSLGAVCSLEVNAGTAGDRVSTVLRVRGVGVDGLHEAAGVLACRNSGTTMRLMSGVLAGQPFLSVLDGDDSLRSRPMGRIVEPLRKMGARIDGRDGGKLAPLTIRGGGLKGIRYRTPVASAQVKSAVLLAGLFAEGQTVVEEPAATRDHTERMLAAMGARIDGEGPAVRIAPGPLRALSMRIPNDLSAAAFWIVGACIHPDAELRLTGVGINPTRTGLLDALRMMGADIDVEEERVVGGEPVADIVARSSRLEGIEASGDLVLRAIDEIPALAVAAAFAQGTTIITDAQELREKESDRIATVVSQLCAVGARVEERVDGMVIEGGVPLTGGDVRSFGDHRLAMAFAAAALSAKGPITIDDADAASVSYPDFWGDLERVRS